jgi:hypothetical protein
MSIPSINERVNELVSSEQTLAQDKIPELTKANVSNTEPLSYEVADIDNSQDVLVAGLPSVAKEIVSGVSKMFTKETKAKVTKGIDNVDEVPPAPPITPVNPDVPMVVPKAKGIPQPKTIEEFQAALPLAKAEGAPPDVLVNLDKIDGPEDFKKAIDALNIVSGVKVESMSFEQLQKMAVERGYGSSFLQEMGDIKSMYGDVAVDLLRLRFASVNNASIFNDLLKKSIADPSDMDTKASLIFHLNLQPQIIDSYVAVRSGAARATAAGNIVIPSKTSDEMKLILSDPKVDAELKKLGDAMNTLLESSQKEGLINTVSKVGLVSDLWDRTWKNGLLSGLGTHIVNLSSSTTFLASSIATRQMAGFIGAGKRAMGMQGEVELGEAAAMVAGMVHSYRDAFRLGWVALKTGTTREMREGVDIVSDAGSRLEGQYNIFNAKDYGFENETFVKGINGYANFVSLLGGRPIMAMDETFKFLAYRAELYANSYRTMIKSKRQAIMDGKTPDDAEKIGLDAMGNMLGNPPKEIDAVAKDFSHMITFSRELTGHAKAIQQLAQDNLLGRIVMPFVKTPIWVTSESLQHSMVAPLSKQWRADMAAGGSKAELAMAKWGMGSGLMIGAGSMVADGRITGSGPGNTNLKRQYMDSGWRPYSFVFQKGEWDSEFTDWLKSMKIDVSVGSDDKLYVPFRGIDPIAGPLAMISDAVEYARYEDDEDKVGQIILGGVWGLYNYVGQSPFMTSISSITSAFSQNIENPKASFRAAIDAVIKNATTYAVEGSPLGVFNSARGMIARGEDPTRRDITADPNLDTGLKGFYEALNYYKSRTPGMSDELPETYDVFGEVQYRGDPSAPYLSSMSGVRYQTSKQREADKIAIALGMPFNKPKRTISVSVGDESVNVKLAPEDYQLLLKNIGMARIGGKGIQESIVELAKTDGFKDLSKKDQQEVLAGIYAEYVDEAKTALIESRPGIQLRADQAADKMDIKGKFKR